MIHTDHRPLVYFLKSDLHEGIYSYWANVLQRLNLYIQYIPRPRNKVADGLSKTLFRTDLKDNTIKAYNKALREQGPRWIWKDRKDGFKVFLKGLDLAIKAEVVDYSTI